MELLRSRRAIAAAIACFLMSSVPALAFAQTAAPISASAALTMKVQVAPTRIPADGSSHPAIFVQLMVGGKQIVAAPSDYMIYLTSANLSVASVQSTLTIGRGQTYGVASLTTTSVPGTTVITLAATGLSPASVSVATYTLGTQPVQLAAFIAPPALVSDGQTSYYFIVQLQDSTGLPAKSNGSLSVDVTSSSAGVVNLPSTISISAGSSGAFEQFKAGTANGSSTITVQLNGLSSASTIAGGVFLPLSISLNASRQGVLYAGTSVVITVAALSAGIPVSGASVAWGTSDQADKFTNGSLTTDGNGTAAASLSLGTGGNVTVRATVSSPGYGQANASLVLTVQSRIISVQLIPDSTQVNYSQPDVVTALVTSGGRPVVGAHIQWSSTGGVVAPQASVSDSSGTSKVIFESVALGNATISASASAAGYTAGTGTASVTVASGASVSSSGVGFWLFAYVPGPAVFGIPLLLVLLVVLVVLAIFVLRRRRARPEAQPAAPPPENVAPEEMEEAEP